MNNTTANAVSRCFSQHDRSSRNKRKLSKDKTWTSRNLTVLSFPLDTSWSQTYCSVERWEKNSMLPLDSWISSINTPYRYDTHTPVDCLLRKSTSIWSTTSSCCVSFEHHWSNRLFLHTYSLDHRKEHPSFVAPQMYRTILTKDTQKHISRNFGIHLTFFCFT